MARVTITLRMLLEDEFGDPVSPELAQETADLAERAIRSRLMGEGFAPAEVLIEEYTITSEVAPPQWNHAFDLGFSVVSSTDDGSDVTPAMYREALLNRIEELDKDNAWEEAVGASFDSFREGLSGAINGIDLEKDFATVWQALHEWQEREGDLGLEEDREQWDEVCAAMARIREARGLPSEVDVNKPHKVTIMWGEVPQEEDTPQTYSFGSAGELNAFLEGVNEAIGWLDFEVIEPGDVWCFDCCSPHKPHECEKEPA